MFRRKTVVKQQGLWSEVIFRFSRDRMAMISVGIMIILILGAVFAEQIAPEGYDNQNIPMANQTPSAEHWFGTDNLGRDIFARIVYGSRISLQVGLTAVAVSLAAGGLLGAVAAYYGGKTDGLIMRLMDVLLAIPGMLLAIAIAASLGPGLRNMMIAIGIGNVPGYARVVRASFLTIKENEFVEAATAIGASNFRIIMRHILPNAMAPIIVQGTLGIAGAILACAMLSFLGLGIQPPVPEWGAMLSAARQFLRLYPHMATFPGIFIMLTVYALNVIGDGIRDAIDPRLKD